MGFKPEPAIWSHDTGCATSFVVVVGRTRLWSMPLAILTIRKELHGFLFLCIRVVPFSIIMGLCLAALWAAGTPLKTEISWFWTMLTCVKLSSTNQPAKHCLFKLMCWLVRYKLCWLHLPAPISTCCWTTKPSQNWKQGTQYGETRNTIWSQGTSKVILPSQRNAGVDFMLKCYICCS